MIGSGVVWLSGADTAPSTPTVPKLTARLAERLPDLAGEARDRGLAVGPGHRDHHLGLVAVPAARRDRERPARLVADDDGHRQGSEGRLGTREAGGIRQDSGRTHSEGEGDEVGAVGLRARQRHEEVTGLDVAAVDREAGQLGQQRPTSRRRGASR